MARISGVYDGLTLQVMAHANAETCRRLPPDCSDQDRHLIAKRILGTAALGERDPSKMRDDAVSFIKS